ncbi:MAG TPA: T9SS type A sorting domain-containing protein, partial [Candidatus Cloacimonadota bacterium]|nr:T9SS type A sorting domain-containing protein [Candidatus Cloacimonadota bacterium]
CCQLDNVAGDDIIVLRCYSGDEPIQYEYYYNGIFSEPVIVPFNGNYTLHSSFKYTHGDFNNDGLQDIVLTGFVEISTNRIYWCYMYSLGNHQFTEPVWMQCYYNANGDLDVSDINNDGFDDIVLLDSSIFVLYSTGTSFVSYEIYGNYHYVSVATTDFDNDSDGDIVANSWEGGWNNHHRYYENASYQQFVLHDQVFQHFWGNMFIAKLNADAYPDLISIYGVGFAVFINQQDWTTVLGSDYDVTTGISVKATVGRFNNDEFDDIAITRLTATDNNLSIRYCYGDGNFLETPVSNQDEVIPSTTHIIQCYPNPCVDFVNFKTKSNDPNTSYTIYNIKGQAVKHLKFPGQEYQWDLTDDKGLKLESGMYLLRSRNQQGDYVSKFIIQK